MENAREKKNHSQSAKPVSKPVFYEIKVQGQLDPQRSKWFEGMTLQTIENGDNGMACTLILGPVIDQPALYGLLNKIRDLNLTLISVRRYTLGTSSMEENI